VVDRVFIGSCTNSRIEDLRAAAVVAKGRKVVIPSWVVAGSGLVKKQAEAEGLDKIFREAGFEWREPGCSMCVGMNGDTGLPGQRIASTSNRNFIGRQGRGVRTHLLSPAMAVRGSAGHPAISPTCAGCWPRRRSHHGTLHHAVGGGDPHRPAQTSTTDQIIPARFLGKPRDMQVAAVFNDLRYDPEGRPRPDFVMNQKEFADAKIVVAERNFACGSSRENAVTVMLDNGLRAYIAPSFGDIFFNNCFQNGALPIRLDAARVAAIRAALRAKPGSKITIDLATRPSPARTARPTGSRSIRSARSACSRASTRSTSP